MSQNKRVKDKMASAEEIKWMCKFIGGFEKWSLLNDDCKRKVLEVLDINTRLSLGYCSKGDYSLMNTTPFYLQGIELDDSRKDYPAFQEDEFDNVTVVIKRQNDWRSKDEMTWVFSQLGEDTQIRWVQKFRRRRMGNFRETILKNCDYYEEAVKFAEMWMKRCQFKMESIDIDTERYPMERSQIVSLPKCTSVRIVSKSEGELRWWLQKLPAKQRSLTLYVPEAVISRDFLSSQQITNTDKLQIRCGSDFSDEQLLSLKARDIEIAAVAITDDGVNKFIKRWINGNGVKDFNKLLLRNQPRFDVGLMIKGVEVRLWDEDFREEEPTYWSEFHRFWGQGETYQICSRVDPYESLTLHFYEKEVCVAHTGKRLETRDGEPYTDYRVP